MKLNIRLLTKIMVKRIKEDEALKKNITTLENCFDLWVEVNPSYTNSLRTPSLGYSLLFKSLSTILFNRVLSAEIILILKSVSV